MNRRELLQGAVGLGALGLGAPALASATTGNSETVPFFYHRLVHPYTGERLKLNHLQTLALTGEDTYDNLAVASHRRAGASVLLTLKVLRQLHEKPGAQILIISPNYGMAKHHLNHIHSWAYTNRRLIPDLLVLKESTGVLKFANGAQVCVTSDYYARIRGCGQRYDAVLVDNADHVQDAHVVMAVTCVMDAANREWKGWSLFGGTSGYTVGDPNNFYRKMVEDPESTRFCRRIHLPAEKNPDYQGAFDQPRSFYRYEFYKDYWAKEYALQWS